MAGTVLPVEQVYGGNPYRDEYEPKKTEIIQYLKNLEAMIAGTDLPGLTEKSYIVAFNVAGAPNAITADTAIPVPDIGGGALIALPIAVTNDDSPVTVSFNDGAALTVKGRDQEDVAPGDLVPGIVAGYKLGSAFQLITDVSSLRNYLAARDEADRATTQADRATSEAAASQTSAQQAQDLVTQATAGFTGFADGQAYDFGFVADPTTYFDQDWGTIA